MLTKEFAQRVELSEKQVRKIVQHLEERGYQLSKTEYRGREATDFKEEDIELFKDIAEKVKQTNSYDLAFDELEQEKDFLQVIVKDDNNQLPTTNQNVAQLVEDLRTEIQSMREERQMLGHMISQVNQQQQELKELQQQITNKLEDHATSLQTIQNTQESIQQVQVSQGETLAHTNTAVDELTTQQKEQQEAQKEAAASASNQNDNQGTVNTASSHTTPYRPQPEKKGLLARIFNL